MLTYKIVNNLVELNIDNFITLESTTSTHNLRKHRLCIKYPGFTKNTIRDNFYSHRCFKIWNKLPENVVTSPSLSVFKVRIDKLDLYKYFDSKL